MGTKAKTIIKVDRKEKEHRRQVKICESKVGDTNEKADRISKEAEEKLRKVEEKLRKAEEKLRKAEEKSRGEEAARLRGQEKRSKFGNLMSRDWHGGPWAQNFIFSGGIHNLRPRNLEPTRSIRLLGLLIPVQGLKKVMGYREIWKRIRGMDCQETHEHVHSEHSMAELLDGLQEEICPLRAYPEYGTKGRRVQFAVRKNKSTLGYRTIKNLDPPEPMANGSSTNDETNDQNIKFAILEIRRRTMAD